MKLQVKMAFTIFALLFSFALFNPVLAQEQGEHLYVKIEVDGLSCPFCAFGLKKKLKKIEGVEKVDVSVKNAGFTPREISFSSIPFKKDDK